MLTIDMGSRRPAEAKRSICQETDRPTSRSPLLDAIGDWRATRPRYTQTPPTNTA